MYRNSIHVCAGWFSLRESVSQGPFGSDGLKHEYSNPPSRSCHLGQTIVYDTITKLGWGADARSHPIKVLIDGVLKVEPEKSPWVWVDDQGRTREVPAPTIDEECYVSLLHPRSSFTRLAPY